MSAARDQYAIKGSELRYEDRMYPCIFGVCRDDSIWMSFGDGRPDGGYHHQADFPFDVEVAQLVAERFNAVRPRVRVKAGRRER